MKVTLEGKKGSEELVIRIPVQKPKPSASGKTLVIATTGGNKPVDCKYEGEIITLGMTAYIKPAK